MIEFQDVDSTQPAHQPFGFGWPALFLFGLLAVAVYRIFLVADPLGNGDGGDHQMLAQTTNSLRSPRRLSPRGDLKPHEKETVRLFRECSQSVVFIKSATVSASRFTGISRENPSGTGSGFVWDQEGHIVTNYHVVANADRARVILPDQSSWEARAVGYAGSKDIAILKIDAPKKLLKPIAVGSSRDLEVGQFAMAIGNPFGLDQTLTTGIVSGLDREIKSPSGRRISEVIQTDAAINPGNSGGPLLDSSGRLIGVNTAIVSPSGAYAGIGFAIPVDAVNRIVPQLITHGAIVRPWLGIVMLDPRILSRMKVEGVIIGDVVKGGPADLAGMRPTRVDDEVQLGDIIVQMDDTVIKERDDLFDFLEAASVGQDVTIKVMRPDIRKSGEVRFDKIELSAKLKEDLQ